MQNNMIKAAKKNLILITLISIAATSVLGVLFHFAYDFFGKNAIAALIFPINESVWEHLKLLFFPMLLCLIIMSAFYPHKNKSCYVTGLAMGLIGGCITIVTFFLYCYRRNRQKYRLAEYCYILYRRHCCPPDFLLLCSNAPKQYLCIPQPP